MMTVYFTKPPLLKKHAQYLECFRGESLKWGFSMPKILQNNLGGGDLSI